MLLKKLDLKDSELRKILASDVNGKKRSPEEIERLVAEVRQKAEAELENKYNEARINAANMILNK